ncbi:MAG: hypothetical protein KIH62_004050 [Candidatus Kerfeldbacteria bacterium]|nr:hypothetical protein [Candidatus Kerfeldbacteria bacterium]
MTFIQKNSVESSETGQPSRMQMRAQRMQRGVRIPLNRGHRRPWFWLGAGLAIGVGIVLSVFGIAWSRVIDTIHSLGL